jgi:DHA1 family quinolone resistance protein-like MFS transporter
MPYFGMRYYGEKDERFINRVIKILLVSDIFVTTGLGLVEPTLATFIKDDLADGRIYAAGAASMVFLVTKSLIQLPFSRYVDRRNNVVPWLLFETFATSMVPFVYLFATSTTHLYLAQPLYGIGAGLAYPTWLGLWSTHLDRNHESYEWSLYATATGIGTAVAAGFGALVAQWLGFRFTFLLVGLGSSIGYLSLFFLLDAPKPIKADAHTRHIHPAHPRQRSR